MAPTTHAYKNLWQLSRIIIPALLAIFLFIFSSFYLFLPKFEQILIENKKIMIKELVEATWHIVRHIDNETAKGIYSLDVAQKMAIDHVRDIRFGADNKDYLWINDFRPTLVMHPYRPDLEGQDLSNFTDPQGTRLFMEFVTTAQQKKQGYVPYMWQWKDDPTRIVPKLSYIKVYEPWGWIIGTGIYLNDVEEELAAMTHKMIVASAIILLLVALLTAHQIYYAIAALHRRQEAEEALQQSHDELERKVILRTETIKKEKETAQQYLDVAGVMLVALNRAGEIILINRQGCSLLQVPEQDAIGLNWFDHFLPEKMRGEVKNIFAQLIDGEIALVEFYENPVVTRSGEERIIAFHNTILKNEAGEITGILFSGEDITERLAAAKEIRQKNAFLHNIIESLPYPFYVIDAQSYALILANSAAAHSQEWIGKCCYHLTHKRQTPCDGAAHDCTLAHVLQTKAPVVLEHLHYDKDGNKRNMEVSGYPIFDENNTVVQMIEYSKDITEQKKMKEEKERLQMLLVQAHKMEAIGTMAGGITHHFNNILGAILGYLDLAKDEVAADSLACSYLEKVTHAAKRAAQLVKHITTFSQQEMASDGICRPNQELHAFLKEQRKTIPANITIEENSAADASPIALNKYQFEKILENLFSNACDAMEETGGTLTAGVKNVTLNSADLHGAVEIAPGPYSQLTLHDTGHGINADDLARIFDPFFTTKQVGKGDGIGLSVVYGIVTKCGGLIKAESEVGQGTRITVFLPLAENIPDEAHHCDSE